MAQQRYAMAGLAHTGACPGDAATWVNDLLAGDPAASPATMVVGHIMGERVLRWACAGHPAPPVAAR